ncbi:LysE family transporter [Serratia ureilytica]
MAAALGLSQLFVAVPLAYDAVRMLGAAYLLYLAWKTLRSGSSLQASAGLQAVPTARIFRQGCSPISSTRKWRCSCWRCFRSLSIRVQARWWCRCWRWRRC